MKSGFYIFLFLLSIIHFPSLGQKKLFGKKKGQLAAFKPVEKSNAVYCPSLTFLNLNDYRYYYEPRLYKQIQSYLQENNLPKLQEALDDYVRHFGIDNFSKDLELIWIYAQAAEKSKKILLAKELYRLILKHHRGSKVKSQVRYDSLINPNEKPTYYPLDKYYKLIERWQLVDTLRPPDNMGASMGEEINTPYEEYGLSIGETDQIIYFTSKKLLKDTLHDDVRKYLPVSYDENLYKTTRLGEFGWDLPQPLKTLNTRYNEGSPCVTRDGKTMVFARCNTPDGFGNCDLYISEWDEKSQDWGTADNLGSAVNSYAWDSHPSFSITGDTLYFASDRKGGFGGTDIYFTVRAGKKRWMEAQNIGPVINTQKSELSPFIHPSANILYFASNGHLFNFGSFDIFKTYRSSLKTWCEPKNLGPFVNTPRSEYYFTIDSDSRLLYYARAEKEVNVTPGQASVQDPYTNSDLYSFPLPMEGQPKAIVRFSGKVKEATTGEIFEGVIAIFDIEDKTPIAPKQIAEDGSFEFELIDNKKYMLIVSGENLFRLEELFEVRGDTYKEIKVQGIYQKVASSPASQIETLQFKSIEFDYGSSEILPKMEDDLHLLVDFLIEHPDFLVEIQGHTDSDGNAKDNKTLSQERADAIRDYILSYGRLEPERVIAKGFGSEKPLIPDEKSEEDKRINRRVEFKLFKKEQYTSDATEEDIPQEKSNEGW